MKEYPAEVAAVQVSARVLMRANCLSRGPQPLRRLSAQSKFIFHLHDGDDMIRRRVLEIIQVRVDLSIVGCGA